MRLLAVALVAIAASAFAADASAQTTCSQAFSACARQCGWARSEARNRCVAGCRSQRFQCLRSGTFRTRSGSASGLLKS
jgi:hypothetical protein